MFFSVDIKVNPRRASRKAQQSEVDSGSHQKSRTVILKSFGLLWLVMID